MDRLDIRGLNEAMRDYANDARLTRLERILIVLVAVQTVGNVAMLSLALKGWF